jgi:hypothetical protein
MHGISFEILRDPARDRRAGAMRQLCLALGQVYSMCIQQMEKFLMFESMTMSHP